MPTRNLATPRDRLAREWPARPVSGPAVARQRAASWPASAPVGRRDAEVREVVAGRRRRLEPLVDIEERRAVLRPQIAAPQHHVPPDLERRPPREPTERI